jgi:hypothetical protein
MIPGSQHGRKRCDPRPPCRVSLLHSIYPCLSVKTGHAHWSVAISIVLVAGCAYADHASSAQELVAEALANSRDFATTAIDYRTVLTVQKADSSDAELVETLTGLEDCVFRRDGEAWMLEQAVSVNNGPR